MPTVEEKEEKRRTAGRLVQELARLAPSGGERAGAPLLEIVEGNLRCVLTRIDETPSPLSPRETEIARMVAKGLPNKIIADVLEISPWTVGTHLRRIFAKLDVPSRAAMVAKILARGGDTKTREIGRAERLRSRITS